LIVYEKTLLHSPHLLTTIIIKKKNKEEESEIEKRDVRQENTRITNTKQKPALQLDRHPLICISPHFSSPPFMMDTSQSLYRPSF